jgi:hypothetical protein
MNNHSVVLSVCTYDESSPLCNGDQIMVPNRIWTAFDAKHSGTGPIFVDVGDEGIVCRISPATAADGLDEDCCRVPTATWVRLGAPLPGELWVHVTARWLPTVGAITLRAHKERSLTDLADPVTTLSTEIAAAWSCVSDGDELVLPCGSFDVVGLKDVAGDVVTAGCILNTDVNLEIVPAIDARESPPAPMPTPAFGPSSSNANTTLPSFPDDTRFYGRGYRLGSS